MKLGQEVKAAAHLVRKTIIKPGQGWGFAGKEWHRSVYPEARAGILVGLRTVTDGHRVNLGEEGIAYKATAHHRVALVSFDLHRAPRFVLLADLDPIPSQDTPIAIAASMADPIQSQDTEPTERT